MSPTDATAAVAALLPAGDADARLDALKRLPEGEARRAAAGQLESLFLVQLLRAMRRTVPESDFLPRSPERTLYEGVFDQAVADALAAEDPLGLVRSLGQGSPGGSSPGRAVPITAVERKDGPER